MHNVRATQKLADLEIDAGLVGNRSWHHQFRHSAYIFVGGLHQGLTEGDLIIVFSQFGEIIDVNLVRDRSTGKTKGFGFICYEDQRSTVLAVDNMNGYQLLNRTLRVDHCEKYKAPKDLDEDNLDENGDPTVKKYEATGAEGKGHGVYNVLGSQKKMNDIAEQRQQSTQARGGKREDEDEAWAKAFEATLKESGGAEDELEELRKAKKELKKMKEEAKRLKKESKKSKKEKKRRKSKQVGEKKKQKDKGRDTVKSSDDSTGNDSSEDSESSDSSAAKTRRKKRKD